MSNKYTFYRINLILLFSSILILSMDITVSGNIQIFQFNQLDDFFEEKLFGVKFDYNSEAPNSEALNLIHNIITNENISDQVDPDLAMDNILALVGHESRDIHSAFFAVENIKRTEFIPFLDFIEWQTPLPFVKNLILYDLPSGENVIMAQDFLGIALRLDGQDFDYSDYKVGYANIPIDFLDFLSETLLSGLKINERIESGSEIVSASIKSLPSPMLISVCTTENELTVKTTYFNSTYLFQTQDIDFEHIANFGISDHFLIVQFDEVEITNTLLKYSNSMSSGVETHLEIRVGKAINLIINEKRPDEEIWIQSFEKHLETNYNEIFNINDTFSWYRGEEIAKRLSLFNKISMSFLISQNIGIINGTQNKDNFEIRLSGQNVSREELLQTDFTVSDNITILHNEDILSTTIVDGYDYALEEDPLTKTQSITAASVNLVALNQYPSLSNNILFLRETALINELVAECTKRFVDNDSLTALTTDQLLKITKLYMTAAIYVQDLQVKDWNGYPIKMTSFSMARLKSNNSNFGLSKISYFSLFPCVLSIAILVVFRVGRRRSKT